MKMVAAIMMLVWGVLIVQPSFALFGGKSAYGECNKKESVEPSCGKSKSRTKCNSKKEDEKHCTNKPCGQSEKKEGKSNCGADGCNPSLGCSSGNFYVHQHFQITLSSWYIQKQMAEVVDDNRISNKINECWHPPEA